MHFHPSKRTPIVLEPNRCRRNTERYLFCGPQTVPKLSEVFGSFFLLAGEALGILESLYGQNPRITEGKDWVRSQRPSNSILSVVQESTTTASWTNLFILQIYMASHLSQICLGS